VRHLLLITSCIALSGCSSMGIHSFDDLRYKLFPDDPAEFSVTHQQSAAEDIADSLVDRVPNGKSLAFVESESSSFQPAIEALLLRGFSVVSVHDTSHVPADDLQVSYNLDALDDEPDFAVAEIKVADGLRISRIYTDTGTAFIPASPVTVREGDWK